MSLCTREALPFPGREMYMDSNTTESPEEEVPSSSGVPHHARDEVAQRVLANLALVALGEVVREELGYSM